MTIIIVIVMIIVSIMMKIMNIVMIVIVIGHYDDHDFQHYPKVHIRKSFPITLTYSAPDMMIIAMRVTISIVECQN